MAAREECSFVNSIIRGGYENSSNRSGSIADHRADARKFVHRPQESDGRKARGGERILGAGGRRPATASGLDSQSGGNGERLCGAGADGLWRDREGAFRPAWSAFSG